MFSLSQSIYVARAEPFLSVQQSVAERGRKVLGTVRCTVEEYLN
jgi:hypothetical protein